MKFKKLLLFLALISFGVSSCSKSGCPTVDKKTGEMKITDNKRTKSGLFPKGM